MKIFISYSHEDRLIVREIKECLCEYFGFDCFLAHEDLNPTELWENRIEENLRICNLFILIVSERSIASSFVNQEIGFAYGIGKIIVPIKIDKSNPDGFVQKVQAMKIYKKTEITEKIYELFIYLLAIDKFTDVRSDLIDGLISAFISCNSIKKAGILARYLSVIADRFDLSKSQLLKIKSGIENNVKIQKENYRLPQFKKILLEKYSIEF